MKRELAESVRMSEIDSVRGSTSRSLLARLKKNQPPAWRDLVHLYSPLIFFWARKSGLPESECADVIQEVFRSVFTNIAKFRKEKKCDTFRGWLRTITRNKVLDHFRRKEGSPDAVGGTEATSRMAQNVGLDDELEGDEQALAAEHALFMRAIEMIRDEFKPQTWNAFWKVVVEGKTAVEVADELGIQSGTVRVAKSRVLKKLRQQLGEQN